MKIFILGSGTWGIALAKTLALVGNQVIVWSEFSQEIEQLNSFYTHLNLPGVELPKTIFFTTKLNDLRKSQFIIVAVPSIYVRSTIKKASPYIDEQIIIIASKGIEDITLMTLTEVIQDELGNVPVVAFSGPTHAEEVAQEMPTLAVAASKDNEKAKRVVDLFGSTCIRVYTNTDVKGIELCGAMKNIIALAVGIADGLGYGDNIKAALITRGMAEIRRLGVEMGCFEQTFFGLAGIGDLIVTATSKLSRNHRCGHYIGEGYSVKEAIEKVGMVVEGLNALSAAVNLADLHNVDMPLVKCVDAIVKGADVKKTVYELTKRPNRNELDKTSDQLIFENQIINKQRSSGMKRVITYGTFDLLHYGHINLLRRAKALGDYLIVCVSTDEFNLNEKHKKTYFTYEQRKVLLESLRYVDLVIPEENWQQKKTDMHEYHIDTFVMGDDWKGKFDFLKDEGVDVVYLIRTPEISTSKMKKDLNCANPVNSESKTSHKDIDTNPLNK